MRIRFGIRTKLVGIINIILLVAAGTIVVFATQLFSKDNVARIQETNLDTARLIAQEIQNDFSNLSEKMRLIGLTVMQPLSASELEKLQKPFFEGEKDLLLETVWQLTPSGEAKLVGSSQNEAVLKSLELSRDDVLRIQEKIERTQLFAVQESIGNDQLQGKIPVLSVTLPLISDDQGKVTHAVVATLKQDRFLKAVTSSGFTVSFLVDSKGDVIAHPDLARVLKRENLNHLEIVKQMLSGKTNNGQTRFLDPVTGVAYLGAFRTVGFSGIGVVSQVDEAKALEAARKVRNSSVIITGMVAVLAFLVIFFFSLSLTRPLVRLVDATAAIMKGEYDITLKKGANDEIGDLTESFGQMAQGLAEREKIKNAFSKFHSKDVADKILAGELNLSGERKDVTIFFSDIRSFTSISEQLQPEQVVELVNSYMTRMVRIIFAHGGVVDKYVGDAIMAVYGTPVSYGNDALRAVSAALRMRAELVRYNEDQKAMGKPHIAIGMGMNSGPVVAGNIGSPERMEYTILGDNVNLTSRMESLTKEFKTDILISTSTYELIKDQIHCEPRGTTKVKGKADEVAIYEVISFKPGCEFIPPETGYTGESTSMPPVAGAETTRSGFTKTPPPPRPEMTGSITVTRGKGKKVTASAPAAAPAPVAEAPAYVGTAEIDTSQLMSAPSPAPEQAYAAPTEATQLLSTPAASSAPSEAEPFVLEVALEPAADDEAA